jgi:2-polyprenyl-3-methyl-5-hydroxy-6-metoxy-1,4-benzoquinol methylase
MNYKEHWENIYTTRNTQKVNWFQEKPKTSINFLSEFNLSKESKIIDVGGGDSLFVDYLVDNGYNNIFVLDISEKAIEKAKERLGSNSNKVTWIVSDITKFNYDIKFDYWHDRAVFHFLREENEIEEYIKNASNSLNKKAFLTIGTFSESGATKCSGIEIKQYSEKTLSERFEKDFDKIKCFEDVHITPSGDNQNFVFCSFIKK